MLLEWWIMELLSIRLAEGGEYCPLVAATSVSVEQTLATESRATLGQSQCSVGWQMR